MNTAFGNLIKLVISQFRVPNQVPQSTRAVAHTFYVEFLHCRLISNLWVVQGLEFFAFAMLMFLDIIVLAVIAYFFKYRDDEEPKPVDQKLQNEKLDTAGGKENPALEMSEMNVSAQQRDTAAVHAVGKKSNQL